MGFKVHIVAQCSHAKEARTEDKGRVAWIRFFKISKVSCTFDIKAFYT